MPRRGTRGANHKVPAIALMIGAGLNFGMIAFTLFSVWLDPNGDFAEVGTLGMSDFETNVFSFVMVLIFVVPLLTSVAIFIGAWKFFKTTSLAWARTSCVLALIPFLNPCPCCLLNLPLGVWGLIVLSDHAVVRRFRGNYGGNLEDAF